MSIEQAIGEADRDKLQRWLMMMLYLDPKTGINTSEPLFETAVERSNIMERVLRKKTGDYKDALEKAFFTGVLSLADVIFHVPMEFFFKRDRSE